MMGRPVLSWMIRSVSFVLMLTLLGSCARDHRPAKNQVAKRLILAGYSAAAPVYQQQIIPLFQDHWREQHGEEILIEATFASSGAQTSAVLGGLAADVVVLSLADEVDRLAADGLIEHAWREGPFGGFVTQSLVAFAVRHDNPLHIHTWEDLLDPALHILMPSPKTSGCGMWCISAIDAAGLFPGAGTLPAAADSVAAIKLLTGIQNRLLVMDRSAYRAMQTFNSGLGDVLISYESEILWQRQQGQALELVIPDRSLRIENPVAVVDRFVEAHGTRELAETFVTFLSSPEAQRVFARYGLRPVDPDILREYAEQFPRIDRVIDIAELGGWEAVRQGLFGTEGIWTRILQQAGSAPITGTPVDPGKGSPGSAE